MRRVLVAFVLLITALAAPAAAQQNFPVIGIWRAQVNDQSGGPQIVETVIQGNGTFSQQWRGRNSLLTYSGQWRMLRADGLFRFEIQDWEPKQWCGPLGCTQIQRPPGSTVQIRFNGPNQMLVSDGGSNIIHNRLR